MPIPTTGAWPPPSHAPAYDSYRDWDAWYVGDPDKLRAVYQGRGLNGQNVPPSQRTYPGQYAGGVVGRFSRWLWGAPPPADRRDGRLHVPLPADMAATAANLLFSEPPTLTAPATQKGGKGNAKVQERLELLAEDGLSRTLLHGAEAGSVLGDTYLRPVIDREVSPRAFLTAVHADGALPTIRWEKLIEVTFWSCVGVDGNTHYRLLEHHDVVKGAGRIVYRLHEGTADKLGKNIGLKAMDETKPLAEVTDADGVQVTGLDRLDVVRVPNAGPQRRWRTMSTLKYLGRSDFDGNEQLFDRLDDTWTSWMQDLFIARGRIIVPAYMLQKAPNGQGQGAEFDPHREIYQAMQALPNMQGGGSGAPITAVQFNIRHEEHKATADALVEQALQHAGLSSQTMGDQADGVPVTATEVQQRERQSYMTRGNRIQTWVPAIADSVELLLAVERAAGMSDLEPVKPNVEFGDSVSEAPETVARTVSLLDAAHAISTETKVRMVHPDWDDTEVGEEVRKILDEQRVENADSFNGDFGNGGSAGGGSDPDGEDESGQ
ncbi:MAG: phage portal protein [Hamadaea sp.]|nr:phage portal protein [Hamadaea sp.]